MRYMNLLTLTIKVICWTKICAITQWCLLQWRIQYCDRCEP